MTAVRAEPDGGFVVDAAQYRLHVRRDGLLAVLNGADGRHWASLRLLAAVDCADGPDETLAVGEPRVAEGPEPTIEIERRSTRWERASTFVICADDSVTIRTSVRGRGGLADVHLLGGRALIPGLPTGFLPSGSTFRTLFSPNPGPSDRPLRSAAERAVIGVVGDSEPGRGHWFFTPAPLFLALTAAAGLADPRESASGGWLGISIVAPIQESTFVELAYEPGDQAFSLVLDYDGHTWVDGDFFAPDVVLTPGIPDPYGGLRRHREHVVARGAASAPTPREVPSWWRAPIFCGWGAQCHLAETTRRRPAELCTQASYDAFLDHLERHDVVPGTVAVDDKWQEAYGTCEPDRRKWPDLRQWIATRRSRGQRVLLWWKAWDPEGLPAELCIRNPDGAPVALDPTNPAAREELPRIVARMLAPDGLDADGLKVDFTGRTPSGRALSSHGRGWGFALLHELLALVYAAAKEAKADALLITHTPHPGFVDVTDMVRLNDMIRPEGSDPAALVAQMRYRAEVARAACPELLIDTDDWRAPDRASWRAYLEIKPELGVPSLYYATHVDSTGEPLEVEDYAALRRAWARSGAA
jgi:hypothetical protein